MKNQFWACSLALVLLLSGVAYIALAAASPVHSDSEMVVLSDSEMAELSGTAASPVHSDSEMVVLSDSEMAELSGTAYDQRCGTKNGRGCSNSTCRQTPFGIATYGVRFNDCYWSAGWECTWRGPHDAQVYCRNAKYTNNCASYSHTDNDTTSDCASRRVDN